MTSSSKRALGPIVLVGCGALAIAAATQYMRSPGCDDRLSFVLDEPLSAPGSYAVALTADGASFECSVTVKAREDGVLIGTREACRPQGRLAMQWRGAALVAVVLEQAPASARLVVQSGERVLYDAVIRPRYEDFDGCSQSTQFLSRVR